MCEFPPTEHLELNGSIKTVKDVQQYYAHMLILVLLILVPSFGFLAITRSHGLGIVRDLVGMNPTGPPDLSKPPRTLKNGQRT